MVEELKSMVGMDETILYEGKSWIQNKISRIGRSLPER